MAKDPAAGMSEGQRAYEARRAAKAGMTLEKWLARKAKARARAADGPAPAAPPKPGLLGGLFRRPKR